MPDFQTRFSSVRSALQELERFAFAVFHLIDRALTRIFVGSPSNNLRAVAKSTTGKMIVGNFDDNSWINWLPFAGAFGAPAARSTGGVASESRLFF